ncbi:unnamed protein product, partial [Brachionus calyciflorus]
FKIISQLINLMSTQSQKRRRRLTSIFLENNDNNNQLNLENLNSLNETNSQNVIDENGENSTQDSLSTQMNLSDLIKKYFQETSVKDLNNTPTEMIQCLECKNNKVNKFYHKSTSKTNLIYHLETIHSVKNSKKSRIINENVSFDQDKIDRTLLFCIIFCFLPFSIVEKKEFKDFVFALNSNYKIPSRKKLRLLLDDIYEEKKK